MPMPACSEIKEAWLSIAPDGTAVTNAGPLEGFF